MNSGKFKALSAACCIAGALLTAGGAGYQYYLSRVGYVGSVMSDVNEFSSIRELVVISTSIPVWVGYGEGDVVSVEYTDGLPLIFSEDNGRLRVEQDSTFTMRIFSPRYDDAHIRITLPHKNFESISLSSSSGDIEMDSVNSSYSEVSTKNGSIKLSNIDERTKIATEGGDISASYSSLSGDAQINAGKGKVELYLPEDLSFGLEFLTDGGYLVSEYFDKSYGDRKGDVFVLHTPDGQAGGAANILRVNTTGGNLYIY